MGKEEAFRRRMLCGFEPVIFMSQVRARAFERHVPTITGIYNCLD